VPHGTKHIRAAHINIVVRLHARRPSPSPPRRVCITKHDSLSLRKLLIRPFTRAEPGPPAACCESWERAQCPSYTHTHARGVRRLIEKNATTRLVPAEIRMSRVRVVIRLAAVCLREKEGRRDGGTRGPELINRISGIPRDGRGSAMILRRRRRRRCWRARFPAGAPVDRYTE